MSKAKICRAARALTLWRSHQPISPRWTRTAVRTELVRVDRDQQGGASVSEPVPLPTATSWVTATIWLLRVFVSVSAEVEHLHRQMDYNLSARQRLFVRGNLQYDTTVGAKQFPTSSAAIPRVTTIPRNFRWPRMERSDTVVNNLRYGFVRQGYATGEPPTTTI